MPFAAWLVSLAAFWAVGLAYLDGYTLDLGALTLPAARHAWCLLMWSFFGSLSAAFLAYGAARAVATRYGVERFAEEWAASSDRTWLIGASVLAALFPLGVRLLLLDGAPLTDDEAAYRFAARVLARGQLSLPSPPMKLFFDHTMIINDGRMYALYFLGWPAVMVPGVWIGAPWLMNPLCSALTVPPLFFILRRWVGSAWARAGLVLFVASPFLMVGAATELSHTSCLAALAWCLWFLLRSRDADSPWWSHAGVSAVFALAFFIRPLSALGIGLPILLAWAWALRGLPPARARRAAAAFALPAFCIAALFLGTNRALYGSYLTTGYDAYARYVEANEWRFATAVPSQPRIPLGMHFAGPTMALAKTALALLRLNFDLFGWSCSLLFAGFAATREARLPWALLTSFFAIHFFLYDSGVDSFGPVHFYETALPILLLSVLGLARLTRRLADPQAGAADQTLRAALPAALLAAMIGTAWMGYGAVRFRALHRIAANINTPHRAVERAGLRRAVVFSPWPFAPDCLSHPTNYFVFQRPASHPALPDDILWVNHISVPEDQKLMALFPDREGFILQWLKPCNVTLIPIAGLAPKAVPDGQLRADE